MFEWFWCETLQNLRVGLCHISQLWAKKRRECNHRVTPWTSRGWGSIHTTLKLLEVGMLKQCWKLLFNSRELTASHRMPLYWLFGHTSPVRHCVMWQNVLFSYLTKYLNLIFQHISKSGSQFGSQSSAIKLCFTGALELYQVLMTRKSRTATKQDKPMMRHNLIVRLKGIMELLITLLRAAQRHQTVRIVMKLLSLSPLQWLIFTVMIQEGIHYHLLPCITQSTCHSRCCLLSLVFKSFPIRFITSSSRPQNTPYRCIAHLHWRGNQCLVCACLCNLWASQQSSTFLLLCQCPSETRHALETLPPINQVLVTIWLSLSLVWLNRRWKHGMPLLASIWTTLTRNRNDIEKAASNTASMTASTIQCWCRYQIAKQVGPRLIPPASSAVLSAPHWLSLFNSRGKIWGPNFVFHTWGIVGAIGSVPIFVVNHKLKFTPVSKG